MKLTNGRTLSLVIAAVNALVTATIILVIIGRGGSVRVENVVITLGIIFYAFACIWYPEEIADLWSVRWLYGAVFDIDSGYCLVTGWVLLVAVVPAMAMFAGYAR